MREKKKGDDSGKGGELVGEGERWDGGDVATIRSALCLVTKKNVTDGCRSLETKDKVRERQKMRRGQRRAVSGQKESQKRRVAHGGEKLGPVSGWWTQGHG